MATAEQHTIDTMSMRAHLGARIAVNVGSSTATEADAATLLAACDDIDWLVLQADKFMQELSAEFRAQLLDIATGARGNTSVTFARIAWSGPIRTDAGAYLNSATEELPLVRDFFLYPPRNTGEYQLFLRFVTESCTPTP
ncbi:hypothetical protein GII36_02085 [Candidatus Mycosynbacter amalyticus]|uniref:Uncharacterized protein n=1 Tax=Candidatus Mycosynbacter amalyticus TaxID=2665156 RepID=A0A857MKH3_9BACT|nr:hypothetical protein [Candidatus Mycosynbacter amalyticus]QHN42638.1 hypothetical protein GII36_02085 [Candidatus Mycosynbacter amalyticus]